MSQRDKEKLKEELISLIKLAQDPKTCPVAKQVILLQIQNIQELLFKHSPL